MPVLNVIKMKKNVGESFEEVDLFIRIIVTNYRIFLLMRDDANKAKSINSPVLYELNFFLP